MTPTLRTAPSDLGDMPLFSTVEAEARGISRRDLRVLVRRELIWQVARGWYSSRMDAGPEDRHILRALATMRLQGGTTTACRHTAALILGMPLVRTDLSIVEISKESSTHGRTTAGVRVSQLDVERTGRVEVPLPDFETSALTVSPAWAVVGTALTNNLAGALAAGDHALRHAMCGRSEIDAALEDARGAKGVARARETLSHLEPRHESPGETLTAVVLRRSSWTFEPQVAVRAAGRMYRLDFGVRELKLAVEFDGQTKYTGPEVMAAQVVRENHLRDEGWTFVRFDWSDLDDEAGMHSRLAAAAWACRDVT